MDEQERTKVTEEEMEQRIIGLLRNPDIVDKGLLKEEIYKHFLDTGERGFDLLADEIDSGVTFLDKMVRKGLLRKTDLGNYVLKKKNPKE